MKNFISFLLILTITLTLVSCGKNVPLPANITLNKKPLPQVKAILRGKWQLHYLRGGFCGVCEYERSNEFYELGANDQIKWTIDKATMADTTITWIKQEWLNNNIDVMEFYAADEYMHHLAADRIYHDTLILYEPGPDGMSYYLTRVK